MPESLVSRFDNIKDTQKSLSTLIDYIRYAVSEFNQHDVYFGHGTHNAFQEAHVLVLSALAFPVDISQEDLNAYYSCQLTEQERGLILEWIQIRCEQGLPLPYLTNQAWFAGMPFYVDKRVLIPRSPFAELIKDKFSGFLTQTLAQPTQGMASLTQGLSSIAQDETPQMILDMCTGGGCIAIALAQTFPEAQVDAVDIDSDALDVAAINIEQYQLESRVFPIQSDLFSSLSGQKYDLVVINPPYVDAQDMADLPREYHHEPERALASGSDGLDLCVSILQQAALYMNDNAWLFVEVGNSEVNFEQRFGDIDVKWCELKDGGSGIFAIHKSQLDAQASKIQQIK